MREFRWINSRIRFAGRSSYVDCRGLHLDTICAWSRRAYVPDLIPSFNSGRLRVFGGTFTSTELADYPQYELMLQPILLIEFEENRAFLIEVRFQYSMNAKTLHVHVHFPRVCLTQRRTFSTTLSQTLHERELLGPKEALKLVRPSMLQKRSRCEITAKSIKHLMRACGSL